VFGTGISWAGFLLLVLTGWTLVGALGIAISYRRKEYPTARRHLGWIAGVWIVYLAVLLAVSLSTRPRAIPPGQPQCMGELCFTVTGSQAMPGYLTRNGERVLRVSIEISNRSAKKRLAEKTLQAYLVDSQNRSWYQLPGLQGIPLTTAVAPGGSIVSMPVFKVPADSAGLQLIFTRGRGLPYALMMGDRDSLLHPPVFVALER
jgi:hypothetical protein